MFHNRFLVFLVKSDILAIIIDARMLQPPLLNFLRFDAYSGAHSVKQLDQTVCFVNHHGAAEEIWCAATADS